MKLVAALNLNTNELQNAVIQNLPYASEPTGITGRVYFDTTAYHSNIRVFNGTSWVSVITSSPDATGLLGILTPIKGGTGIANQDTSTITLGGAFATTGAFTTSFTQGANLVLTLPVAATATMLYNTVNPTAQFNLPYANGADGSIAYTAAPLTNGTWGLSSVVIADAAVKPLWVQGTGTGAPVFAASPTFTGTVALPIATATSINGLTITTTTGTLTIANNASASLITTGNYAITLAANAASTVTMPSSTAATLNYYTTVPVTNGIPYAGAASGLISYTGAGSYSTLVSSSVGVPQWTTAAAGVLFAVDSTTVPAFTTAITGCTYNGLTVTSTTGTLTVAASSTANFGASFTTGAYAVSLTTAGASTVAMPNSTAATLNYYTTAPAANALPYAGAASGLISYLGVPVALSVLTNVANSAPSWVTATGTGAPVMGTNPAITVSTAGNLSLSYTPTNANDATPKWYVDGAIQGLQQKPTASKATTAPLNASQTYIYDPGVLGVGATLTNANSQVALVIDGIPCVVGDVVLVKNEITYPGYNGLYVVTAVGSVSTNWVLTRHIDMDTAAEFAGAFIPVGNSAALLLSGTQTVTVDTVAKTIILSGTGTINWTTLGAVAGESLVFAGWTNSQRGNNGIYNNVAISTTTHTNDTITYSTQFPDGVASGFQVGNVSVFLTGTSNSNSLWLTENTGAVTVGTTPITFIQLNAATNINAGNQIQISGNTINVTATPTFTTVNSLGITAGTSSTINVAASTGLAVTGGSSFVATLNAQATATLQLPAVNSTLLYNTGTTANAIPFSVSTSGSTSYISNITTTKMFLSQTGTGSAANTPVLAALTSADITTALGYVLPPVTKFATTIQAAGPSYLITHNLNTFDVTVTVYENATGPTGITGSGSTTGSQVYPDIVTTSVNSVTLTYGIGAPVTVYHRVVVVG